jgi:hypothetical protein
MLSTTAGITAKANLVPIACPFLPPGKRSTAGGADFLRQMLFLDAIHSRVI